MSKPVNRKLFEIFKTCGFVEESGHRVPTITKIYGNEAFDFDGEFIFVTIPFDRTWFAKETTKENAKKKIYLY